MTTIFSFAGWLLQGDFYGKCGNIIAYMLAFWLFEIKNR